MGENFSGSEKRASQAAAPKVGDEAEGKAAIRVSQT